MRSASQRDSHIGIRRIALVAAALVLLVGASDPGGSKRPQPVLEHQARALTPDPL